jgi:3-oxoacyl-[acyl-carrier protein] reductase
MDLGLNGKTAMVLGASGGLGGAIAESIYAEGANVVLVGRTSTRLEERAAALSLSPERSLNITWDLGELDRLDDHVTQVEGRFGGIDILINNTGGPPPTPVSGQDQATWTTHFNSMVLSVIALTDRVLPGMRERNWGRIITSVSSGVVSPIPNLGMSNTLRSSLLGWSKTLAREVGSANITSNVIVPGRIATQRTAALDSAKAKREDRLVEDVARESAASIPLGRYGTPDEYGRVAAFLASEAASYITGSVIRVDGGLIPSI